MNHNFEEDSLNSDNCLIEGLRIELEAFLGLRLFKVVYDIIHDNVTSIQIININNFVD